MIAGFWVQGRVDHEPWLFRSAERRAGEAECGTWHIAISRA